MTRIWLVNWHFQSRITLWCRHKSINFSIGLCWQMPKFIVWCLWSIYFDHHLPLKPSIGNGGSKVVHLITNSSSIDISAVAAILNRTFSNHTLCGLSNRFTNTFVLSQFNALQTIARIKADIKVLSPCLRVSLFVLCRRDSSLRWPATDAQILHIFSFHKILKTIL